MTDPVLIRRLSLTVRIAWSRVLDVVRPKRDYAGKYPRIHMASPAEAERIQEIVHRRRCGPWEDDGNGIERCQRCGRVTFDLDDDR